MCEAHTLLFELWKATAPHWGYLKRSCRACGGREGFRTLKIEHEAGCAWGAAGAYLTGAEE